jgi:nucleoside-diphosphate-sugar epimerase
LLFGPGYCGRAVARAAAQAGFAIVAASRAPAGHALGEGVRAVGFDAAREPLGEATHVLATAPPGPAGDPVLARYADAIAAAPGLRWIGYLSATSVYGDRAGAAVDEDTPPAPTSERGRRRLAAERAWERAANGRPLDLFRLAGIYGPGRSVLSELRAGRARRVLRPGHMFGRIHRDDIAAAVLAAMRNPPRGTRALNLADDEPAESAAVLEEAARLLGVPVPPGIPFAEAFPAMSPMAQSFWQEARRVSSRKTQEALGIAWRYPSYREGLAAILAEEAGQR